MRTSPRRVSHGVALAAAALLSGAPFAQEAAAKEEAPKAGADWQHWHANSDVTDIPSVQRGARNFVSYCLGCHSLKYERYSRMGTDLGISSELLDKFLVPPGEKATNYILTTMPATDSEAWFGKSPPSASNSVSRWGRSAGARCDTRWRSSRRRTCSSGTLSRTTAERSWWRR